MSSIQDIMKERALRFKYKDIEHKNTEIEKENKEKEKIRIDLIAKNLQVDNFISYLHKIKNNLLHHIMNTDQNIPIILASYINKEFVHKSKKIVNIIKKIELMDNVKKIIFELWDIIQDIADTKMNIKTDIDKKMIKNVEINIKAIFETFDLGPVQFQIIMDDSKDLEYAQLMQNLILIGANDDTISQQLSIHGFQ